MIPPGLPEPNSRRENWRNELRTAFRSAGELCEHLGLQDSSLVRDLDEASDFRTLVPRSFAARIRYGDPQDPLLLQVLARRQEDNDVPGFVADPLNEPDFAVSGMLRKYKGRALLITTAACPIHCRYCFRRHFPYSDQLAARNQWTGPLRQLRESGDIEEVVLSGGDPLSLATSRLTELVNELEQIKTIRTLRIHTRFPVVLPSRITPALTTMLAETQLQTVVVLHCNHANELAANDVTNALRELKDSVDFLLNQSVLLRNINDSVNAQTALSTALLRNGVLPYYLHMLDRVSGSAHFDVPQDEARRIINELRASLPGYLVPKLVREVPGALSKTPAV